MSTSGSSPRSPLAWRREAAASWTAFSWTGRSKPEVPRGDQVKRLRSGSMASRMWVPWMQSRVTQDG